MTSLLRPTRALAGIVCWTMLTGTAFAELAPEDLPTKAQALRDAGLDADEVRAALRAAQEAGLDAAATAGLLGDAVAPVTEHGPIPAFGTFVKTQLDAGLRGADLSGSIRAEHANRGLGRDPVPATPPPAPVRPAPAPQASPPPRPTRPAPTRPAPTRPRPAPQPAPRPSVPDSRFRPKGKP
jgi:hypothetical protein